MKALPVAGIGCLVGEEAEIVSPAQRRLRHEAQRLAGIDAFKKRDFLGPRHNAVGNPVQDGAPCRPVHVTPGGKGVGCRPGRLVNIRRVTPRHRRNPGHVDGRDAVKRPAGPRRTIRPANMIEDGVVAERRQKRLRLCKIVSQGHRDSRSLSGQKIDFDHDCDLIHMLSK